MGMASDQQWLQLALTGLMVALLPLSYAWVKGRHDRYRQLVWLTLILHLRSDPVRRLHPVDRFRSGLPGLARLLWHCQPFFSSCPTSTLPRR